MNNEDKVILIAGGIWLGTWLARILITLSLLGGAIYVVAHFVHKIW